MPLLNLIERKKANYGRMLNSKVVKGNRGHSSVWKSIKPQIKGKEEDTFIRHVCYTNTTYTWTFYPLPQFEDTV